MKPERVIPKQILQTLGTKLNEVEIRAAIVEQFRITLAVWWHTDGTMSVGQGPMEIGG